MLTRINLSQSLGLKLVLKEHLYFLDIKMFQTLLFPQLLEKKVGAVNRKIKLALFKMDN